MLVGYVTDGELGGLRFNLFCLSRDLQLQAGRSSLLLFRSIARPPASWVGLDLIVFVCHMTYRCKMAGSHFYYLGRLRDRRRVGCVSI